IWRSVRNPRRLRLSQWEDLYLSAYDRPLHSGYCERGHWQRPLDMDLPGSHYGTVSGVQPYLDRHRFSQRWQWNNLVHVACEPELELYLHHSPKQRLSTRHAHGQRQ
ncbi:MAG: hypothetical protein L7F78_07345, partial [Syntrophales bacterium LBB04]|nr:hypothetical protein [Syntrophales bacterium LBB04]